MYKNYFVFVLGPLPRESRVFTITWSRSLACVHSSPKGISTLGLGGDANGGTSHPRPGNGTGDAGPGITTPGTATLPGRFHHAKGKLE